MDGFGAFQPRSSNSAIFPVTRKKTTIGKRIAAAFEMSPSPRSMRLDTHTSPKPMAKFRELTNQKVAETTRATDLSISIVDENEPNFFKKVRKCFGATVVLAMC
jgi:hypothetical protein